MKYVVTDEDCVRALTAYDTLRWTPNNCIPMGIDRMRAALESFATTLGETVVVPDEVRVALDSSMADLDYLFGRVATDGSTAKVMRDSLYSRLKIVAEWMPSRETSK